MQIHTEIPSVPERPTSAHKGTFGTVVVVGGSAMMIGAPALTAGAALRTGCGLVKIAAPAKVLPFCLTIEPSATGLRRADMEKVAEDAVLAVGPGMGTGPKRRKLLAHLLSGPRRMVLDADGLNNFAAMAEGDRLNHCPLVMTPHPGEARRLMKVAGLSGDPADAAQRPEIAVALANSFLAVVVLKGQGTIVTDGVRVYTNTTGNPAMATAGTGDVLTGAIASLIAQGMELFDAAVLGVYLHGLAGDLWAKASGPSGLTARDLIALLPAAMSVRRASPPAK